jgi:hypothetical protein
MTSIPSVMLVINYYTYNVCSITWHLFLLSCNSCSITWHLFLLSCNSCSITWHLFLLSCNSCSITWHLFLLSCNSCSITWHLFLLSCWRSLFWLLPSSSPFYHSVILSSVQILHLKHDNIKINKTCLWNTNSTQNDNSIDGHANVKILKKYVTCTITDVTKNAHMI